MFLGDVRGEAIGRHSLPAEPAEGLTGRDVDALHSQQLEWLSVRTSRASGSSSSCSRQVAFETSLEIKVTAASIATDKTANSRHAARCPEPRLSRIVPSRVGGNDGRDDRAICALLVRVPRLAQGERLPYRRFHVDLSRLHQSDVAGRVAPVIGAPPCAGPMMLRTVRPL